MVVLAHVAGSTDGSGGIDPRALALGLAIAAVAVLAGPLLTGSHPVGRRRAVLGHVAGLGAAALATAAGLTRPAAVVAVGVAVLATFLPRGAAPTIVVLGLVAGGGEGRVAVAERALAVAHVVAAALWIAVVLDVALAWRRGGAAGRRTARRAATPAVLLVAVVAATGTVDAADHLGDARLALGTWWGRLLAAKVAVVAVAALAGALLRRAWTPSAETTALGGAAVAGLVLAAAGGPLSGAAPAGPLFLAVDGATVVVAPLAPGRNHIVVSGSGPVEVAVDGRPIAGPTVDLAAGRHVITVGSARFPVTVRDPDAERILTATLAPGDPECVARLAGATAAAEALTRAGRPTRLEVGLGETCGLEGAPAAPPPARPVVAALDALAARGNRGRATVVVDGSARAAALAAALPGAAILDASRDVGADAGGGALPSTGGPIVVATGPAAAGDLARRATAATGGTVPVILAPWLLDAGLLADLAGDGVPVLVAAERDPTSGVAVDYRLAAAALRGGPAPTAAGLRGYVEVLGVDDPPEPGLFGLSRVAILPPGIDPHPSEAGWAPGVALVRVA